MRWWTRLRIELLCVGAMLWASPSIAQNLPSQNPGVRSIRQTVAAAERAFHLNQYDTALRLYTDAYALEPLPALLFNIGQCHRLQGNRQQARFFYGRYLEQAPDGKNADKARQLLAEPISDAPKLANLAPHSLPRRNGPSTAPTPHGADVPIYKQWWFWTGVGVLATGTVIAAAVVASQPPSRRDVGFAPSQVGLTVFP